MVQQVIVQYLIQSIFETDPMGRIIKEGVGTVAPGGRQVVGSTPGQGVDTIRISGIFRISVRHVRNRKAPVYRDPGEAARHHGTPGSVEDTRGYRIVLEIMKNNVTTLK